jgi:hypothetical protein
MKYVNSVTKALQYVNSSGMHSSRSSACAEKEAKVLVYLQGEWQQ